MKTVVLFLAVVCTGCSLFRHDKKEPEYSKPVVVGERLFVLKPGDIVEVPALVDPAKTWYLVDDIGLSFWLGIPYNHVLTDKTVTAYDGAIDGLGAAEAFRKELQEKLDGCRKNSKE